MSSTEDERPDAKTRRPFVAAIAILAIVTCVPIAYQVAYRMPRTSRAARLERERAEAIADFEQLGPVDHAGSGQPPIEGNVAEELFGAAVPFAGVDIDGDDLDTVIDEGRVPSDLRASVDRHRDRLAVVRAAARRDRVWTDLQLARGASASPPPYVAVLTALKLLLVEAALAEPADCMAIATDALRLAYDLRPGGAIIAAMLGPAVAEMAVPILARCSDGATGDELRDARNGIGWLAGELPDLGPCLEAEMLQGAALARELAAPPPYVPWTEEDRYHALHWGDALDAVEWFLDDPAQFRAVADEGYPDSAEVWHAHERATAASDNPIIQLVGSSHRQYVERDMTGAALVRALARAWRFRTETHVDGHLYPSLFDPFTGEPLAFDRDRDGSTITYSSVGPDLVNDWCAAGSDDLCVTVSARSLYGVP